MRDGYDIEGLILTTERVNTRMITPYIFLNSLDFINFAPQTLRVAHPYDDICELRRFGRLHAVSLWRFQSDQSVLGEYIFLIITFIF